MDRHTDIAEQLTFVAVKVADTSSLPTFKSACWLDGDHALAPFRLPPHPDQPAVWFTMQICMTIGFAMSFSVNRWLIH